MKIRLLLLSVALLSGSVLSFSQGYIPSEKNLEARKEFSTRRLGIFLHWGIYSTYAQGEWYLHNASIPASDYAVAAQTFNPVKFDPDKWAAAFRDSGAGYVTFTSRHHEGFSMFPTSVSSYDIIDATPFGRDIVGELARSCEKEGLRYHLYYSLLDWTREDYPLGRTGRRTGRRGDRQDYGSYFSFMKEQIAELLGNYPSVRALWFDGLWDHDSDSVPFDWRLEELYSYIHSLKDDCLIGNNHHLIPFEGEDFQMFERDLPGENKAGLSDNSEIGSLPLEMCQTMNGSWGYRIEDRAYKSVKELVHLLVRAAAKNSNLLLNIGPMANGELPPSALERLEGIGEWMRGHSVSVDNTSSTTIPEQSWGVTTMNGTTLFLHVLSPESLPSRKETSSLLIPLPDGIGVAKKGAVSILSGSSLEYEITGDGFLRISVPEECLEEIDTVICVEYLTRR